MQLYKSRDFSAFFSDTFTFLKENGKHYFKHYFIINGSFLLILAALGYAFSSYFLEDMFGSIGSLNTTNNFDTLINENPIMFIGLILAFIVIVFLFSIISYAYAPIYFKLYEKNNSSNFNTTDIIDYYKANTGKLLIFVILGFLLAIPLGIAFGIAAVILAITIIGFLLLPLLVGLFSGLYNATLLEYLDNKRGFIDSFGYAWTIITSKFWPAIGSMGIFVFMAYIVQISLSIIQSIINTGSALTIPTNTINIDSEISTTMLIITIIVYIITFVVSFIINGILQINQSIVYYSVKEDNDNVNLKSDIDLIGSSEA